MSTRDGMDDWQRQLEREMVDASGCAREPEEDEQAPADRRAPGRLAFDDGEQPCTRTGRPPEILECDECGVLARVILCEGCADHPRPRPVDHYGPWSVYCGNCALRAARAARRG